MEREQRNAQPLIVVVLKRTTAVLSWKEEAETVRRPVSELAVWVLPAETTHWAHWHEPTPLLRIALSAEQLGSGLIESMFVPKVVRLVDLTRMDWLMSELVKRLFVGHGEPREISQEAAAQFGVLAVEAIYGRNSYFRAGSTLTDERFWAVADFIEENLEKRLSRELVAKAGGQSLHHLARMFKDRTGLTPREYVNRRRCFRARELIAKGMKLADVAAEVGFSDQPKMSKKFNEVFGCPPSTFMPTEGA